MIAAAVFVGVLAGWLIYLGVVIVQTIESYETAKAEQGPVDKVEPIPGGNQDEAKSCT